MTTQTIALAGGAILMLLVLLVLRRRRAAGHDDAHESVERPTPILANPASLPAADAGSYTHMGPPAPEPMDWPPFPPSPAAAASDAAARAAEAPDAPLRRSGPAPAAAWAPSDVVDQPGWPTPGEMDMGWAPATTGAAHLDGTAARMNGAGAQVLMANGSAAAGLLSDTFNGFDPAAGWSDDPDAGETGELERVERHPVAEAEAPFSEPHDEPEGWSMPVDLAAPDAVDRAWAAFANDEVVVIPSPAPHAADLIPPPAPPAAVPVEATFEPPNDVPVAVPGAVWEMPAPAHEPPAADQVAEWAPPEPEAAWAMPAAPHVPEPVAASSIPVAEPETVAKVATAPEPEPFVMEPVVEEDPEPAVAWFDEPLPEPVPEPVAWWDEASPEPEHADDPAAEAASSGRFALGGFALQPGHEALTGVTFRAPLAVAPERWQLGGVGPATPGTLVLDLDGALNCDRDDLAVLTASGFAPTSEGFTLRVAARASGPFAASGTFRIAA